MAEQTFRSPGFFDQEIDLSGRQVEASGIPVSYTHLTLPTTPYV